MLEINSRRLKQVTQRSHVSFSECFSRQGVALPNFWEGPEWSTLTTGSCHCAITVPIHYVEFNCASWGHGPTVGTGRFISGVCVMPLNNFWVQLRPNRSMILTVHLHKNTRTKVQSQLRESESQSDGPCHWLQNSYFWYDWALGFQRTW